MTTTEAYFAIAEKEEIVAQLREKYVRARRAAAVAETEAKNAAARAEAAWGVANEARYEYERCDLYLIQQMQESL